MGHSSSHPGRAKVHTVSGIKTVCIKHLFMLQKTPKAGGCKLLSLTHSWEIIPDADVFQGHVNAFGCEFNTEFTQRLNKLDTKILRTLAKTFFFFLNYHHLESFLGDLDAIFVFLIRWNRFS